MFDPNLFREYDIRGKSPDPLSADVAYGVGRALGARIKRAGGTTAVVGRDVRHTSPMLAEAAARGLSASGIDVFDIGQVPTPVAYHATWRLSAGGCVMVTGSHNPKPDNGLKLCLGTSGLYGEAVRSLNAEAAAPAEAVAPGAVRPHPWLDTYLADLCPRFAFRRRFRVAVDCGNGVMGPTALAAFARCGVDVVPLYCEPDGDFPNHLPDPEVPKYMSDLMAKVREVGADLGFGFDGDGDRVGVIDETGTKISADWLVAVFARDMLASHPGGVIRYDVKCGDFLDAWVRDAGGRPEMGKTGHSLLKRDVKALDAVLGGELSGHIIFNRGYLPIDDSLYCALTLLRILEATGGACSSLFAEIPRTVATAEIKVPCADDVKFTVVDALVERFRRDHDVVDIDGARVRVDGGWFLVRASNTTPNLTVRFEAIDTRRLHAARDLLVAALAGHPADPSPLLAET